MSTNFRFSTRNLVQVGGRGRERPPPPGKSEIEAESGNMYLMMNEVDPATGRLGNPKYFGGCQGSAAACTETSTSADVTWVLSQGDAIPLFSEPRVVVTNTASVEKIDGIGFGGSRWIMMYGGRWPDGFLHGLGKFSFPTLTDAVVKDPTEGVQMRNAPNPWGPWSAPETVYSLFSKLTPGYCQIAYANPKYLTTLDCADGLRNRSLNTNNGGNGAEYGIGILKLFSEPTVDGGVWVYWTMSTWNPYGVYVMKSFVQMSGIEIPQEIPHLRKWPPELSRQFNEFVQSASLF